MKKSLIFVLVAILAASIALVACTGNTTEETTVGTEETTLGEETTVAEGEETTVAEGEETTAGEGTTEGSVATSLVAAFKDIVANGTDLTALAIGEQLAQNEAVSAVGMGAMEVEAGFLSGFDNAEITGFKSGVMVAPMIGSIAFVSYVFELEDGADADAFVKTLKDNANLRWNICVTADEMADATEGNFVYFVMAPMSFEA